MINLKVNFTNGDHLHTRFNGSLESAESYYVGKPFNIGNVILDKNYWDYSKTTGKYRNMLSERLHYNKKDIAMKTIKDYTVNFRDYGKITVPAGTKVTHNTAMGIDESYHFVDSFEWIKKHKNGCDQYGLLHDLRYYGLDVPKEYTSK